MFYCETLGRFLSSVDWLREGFSAGKLDYLGMQFGWFYDGHRALSDCEACLALLAQTLPSSKQRVLSVVRETAQQTEYLVCAVGSPFEEKDTLRSRGYRWRPDGLSNGKVWWTTCLDPEAEVAWLRSNVYHFEKVIPVQEVTAMIRFRIVCGIFEEWFIRHPTLTQRPGRSREKYGPQPVRLFLKHRTKTHCTFMPT